MATVVVQCPGCQSKFRIADEKVTDRGVRVRCTSCKNVFQVKRSGVAAEPPKPERQAMPGATQQMQARAPARPNTQSVARPEAPSAPSANTDRQRVHADDLFGMSELTGDISSPPGSPLSSHPGIPAVRAIATAAPQPGKAAVSHKPMISADDFEAALDAAVGNPAPPVAPPVPVPPKANATTPPATLSGSDFSALADPFEGVDLAASFERADTPVDLSDTRKPAEAAPESAAPVSTPRPQTASLPPPSGRSELVGSALTGLVGAALALAFVLGSALSEATGTGWLGLGSGSEVIATRLVSGLYETGDGRLMFFVRGRIVNHGKRPRGPVRVIAELVTDQGPEARAETLAGAEPTPEEIYALKSPGDTERLLRALSRNDGERRIPAGGSLPFFALVSEPPNDLHLLRLRVRLETIDAWSGRPSTPQPPAPSVPQADTPKPDAPRPVPR